MGPFGKAGNARVRAPRRRPAFAHPRRKKGNHAKHPEHKTKNTWPGTMRTEEITSHSETAPLLSAKFAGCFCDCEFLLWSNRKFSVVKLTEFCGLGVAYSITQIGSELHDLAFLNFKVAQPKVRSQSSDNWNAIILLSDFDTASSQLYLVLNCQLFTQGVTIAVILCKYSR